jgi:outer membrane lipoprotein SlyB
MMGVIDFVLAHVINFAGMKLSGLILVLSLPLTGYAQNANLTSSEVAGPGGTTSTYEQNRRYNWRRVKVKLISGQVMRGELVNCTEDSLVMRVEDPEKFEGERSIAYSSISYVGIHKKGAGASGFIVGAISGAALGMAIGHNVSSDAGGVGSPQNMNTAVGGVIGFFVGAKIGVEVAWSNRHRIKGDRAKFVMFIDKITYRKS